MKASETLETILRKALGDDTYFSLIQEFGGTRLFIPTRGAAQSKRLAPVLSPDAINALTKLFAGTYINVPLSREFRALRFRAEGLSNAKIASRLCITEKGVNRIFQRLKNPAAAVANDNRRRAANDAGFPTPKRRLIKAAGDW